MDEDSAQETDPELQAQLTLLAASHHNVESLRTLLRTGSANVQDSDTGFTPLHAAIAACEDPPDSPPTAQNGLTDGAASNGQINGTTEVDAEVSLIEVAARTMRLLLQSGAIWNDVDNKNETPGCLALRLGLRTLYEIMVDAGVRAEILLSRLDEYQQLADNDEDEEEESAEGEANSDQGVDQATTVVGNGHNRSGSYEQATEVTTTENDLRNENYLQSALRFQDGRILDDSDNSVMMAWETSLMRRSADLLTPNPGLKILNIGHGMGIIDTFFQEKSPSVHHIIEAHPSIVERMKKDGWEGKSNVTIHEGRWQDIVPQIMEQGILFDAIYFDTFAEDYKALRDFFSDCIIGLLDDDGKWGFFNGLGADRQICYDVYGKVVEMDLFEAGFDTMWKTIEVPAMPEEEWEGVKRRYWTLKQYKLPICEFIG